MNKSEKYAIITLVLQAILLIIIAYNTATQRARYEEVFKKGVEMGFEAGCQYERNK